MSQHMYGLATQQQPLNAAAAVGSHRDQVATIGMCRIKNSFPRIIVCGASGFEGGDFHFVMPIEWIL